MLETEHICSENHSGSDEMTAVPYQQFRMNKLRYLRTTHKFCEDDDLELCPQQPQQLLFSNLANFYPGSSALYLNLRCSILTLQKKPFNIEYSAGFFHGYFMVLVVNPTVPNEWVVKLG